MEKLLQNQKESNGSNVCRPVCTKYSTSTVRANHAKTKLHILDQKKTLQNASGCTGFALGYEPLDSEISENI